MKHRGVWAGLVALCLFLAFSPAIGAEEKGGGKVTIDQVPPAVKETLLKQAGDNKIRAIERETEGGKTIYEAEWSAGGKEIEVQVDAEGKLISTTVQEKVTLDQVPAAVKEAILKEAKGGKVAEVERATTGDKTTYEAEVVVEGKTREIRVDAEGKVLPQEDEDDEEDDDEDEGENEQRVTLDQVPALVKATLLKEAGDGKVREIERETRNGKTVFEAELIVGGQEIEIIVGEDGTVIRKQAGGRDDDD